MKTIYQKPGICDEVRFQLESSCIMVTSVVDRMKVRSAGQEVEDHDFDSDDFNFEWQE